MSKECCFRCKYFKIDEYHYDFRIEKKLLKMFLGKIRRNESYQCKTKCCRHSPQTVIKKDERGVFPITETDYPRTYYKNWCGDFERSLNENRK